MNKLDQTPQFIKEEEPPAEMAEMGEMSSVANIPINADKIEDKNSFDDESID